MRSIRELNMLAMCFIRTNSTRTLALAILHQDHTRQLILTSHELSVSDHDLSLNASSMLAAFAGCGRAAPAKLGALSLSFARGPMSTSISSSPSTRRRDRDIVLLIHSLFGVAIRCGYAVRYEQARVCCGRSKTCFSETDSDCGARCCGLCTTHGTVKHAST